MNLKKLEIFNNIVLLSDKKIDKSAVFINNVESTIKYLRQNRIMVSQLKKNHLKFHLKIKPRIILCFSDPYLAELAILVKSEIFFEKNNEYQITVMESKDFYMTIPKDIKLVVFLGNLNPKYVSFCLSHKILLINLVSLKHCNKASVYNLPFEINNLSSLIWMLLFYKNI
jgi:hypothetical protein